MTHLQNLVFSITATLGSVGSQVLVSKARILPPQRVNETEMDVETPISLTSQNKNTGLKDKSSKMLKAKKGIEEW